METFKNLESAEDPIEISDHLEKEFLDIVHLFNNERRQKHKIV